MSKHSSDEVDTKGSAQKKSIGKSIDFCTTLLDLAKHDGSGAVQL